MYAPRGLCCQVQRAAAMRITEKNARRRRKLVASSFRRRLLDKRDHQEMYDVRALISSPCHDTMTSTCTVPSNSWPKKEHEL